MRNDMKHTSVLDGAHIVIAKADRIYAEFLTCTCKQLWPQARHDIATNLRELTGFFSPRPPQLLVTGINLADGDALAFLSAWLRLNPTRFPNVLVVTGRHEERTLATLATIPIVGAIDSVTDGIEELLPALSSVSMGSPYFSKSFLKELAEVRRNSNNICERLTLTEQLVLSVIGDGSDDNEAAERLCLKPSTILSIRRELHGKLGIHHRGELVRAAIRLGFVRFAPKIIVRPAYALIASARRPQHSNRIPKSTPCSDSP